MTQGGVLYRPATGRALEPDVLNLAQATIQEPYPDRWLETAVWSGMSVALTLPLFATGSGWGMIGLVAGQAVSASIERMVAGETVGSAVWGGVLDAVGYTALEASVTGVDPRTGGELSGWGRVLSGLEGAAGLAAGVGAAFRGVARLGQLARTLAVAEVQGWARGAGIAAGGAALYATFGDPQTTQAAPLGRVLKGFTRITSAAATNGVNPRLLARLDVWRAYRAGGGTLDMAGWVGRTQGASYGTGFKSGYGNWIRSVESVHGNSALSTRTAYLYRLGDARGNLLKWGITQDLSSRYSAAFLADKRLVRIAQGRRADMLRLERDFIETFPGPLNNEPWAGARLGGW